jgi:hypothetical protein
MRSKRLKVSAQWLTIALLVRCGETTFPNTTGFLMCDVLVDFEAPFCANRDMRFCMFSIRKAAKWGGLIGLN